MPQQKFDEHDRKKVIAEVENRFGIKLSPVGKRRKYLKDGTGKTYWIFGGYEDWHGIPSDMMEAEEKCSDEGILVVAKRNKSTIDIFCGPLRQLINHKRELTHTTKGDFQFNIRIKGNQLYVKEVTGLTLNKLGAATYTGEEKETDKKLDEVTSLLEKMSPGDRQQLLSTFFKFQP